MQSALLGASCEHCSEDGFRAAGLASRKSGQYGPSRGPKQPSSGSFCAQNFELFALSAFRHLCLPHLSLCARGVTGQSPNAQCWRRWARARRRLYTLSVSECRVALSAVESVFCKKPTLAAENPKKGRIRRPSELSEMTPLWEYGGQLSPAKLLLTPKKSSSADFAFWRLPIRDAYMMENAFFLAWPSFVAGARRGCLGTILANGVFMGS